MRRSFLSFFVLLLALPLHAGVSVTGPIAGVDSTGKSLIVLSGKPASKTFVVYNLDAQNNPVETTGSIFIQGTEFLTGYDFAKALFTYAQLTNQ